MFKKRFQVILLGLLAVFSSGELYAQRSISVEPTAIRGGSVTLKFRNIPSEDVSNVNDSYPVSRKDGTISLPYLSSRVRVDGMTARQIEDMLKKRYVDEKIYSSPIIVALVGSQAEASELETRYIQISGEVGSRKNLPYRQGITLFEALIDCGDITQWGSRRIQITRRGQTRTYDYFSMKDRNIELLPGDQVVVQKRGAFEGRPSNLLP